MKSAKKIMICRVCGSKSINIYSTIELPECIWPSKKKTKFSKCHVYSCTKCFHLQLQNFSKKKISNFYGEKQCNTDTSLINKKKIQLIKNTYGKNYFKDRKILDVGGGVNPILKSNNVSIADIKIQNINKKIYKNRCYQVDIEKEKVNQKFDIIFLIHTLEHFKYPNKAIENIKNSLKNNGRLFIEIPNFNFMIKRKTFYSIFHQHLSMFSIKHLQNFLNNSSLKIEKLFYEKNIIFCSVKKIKLKKKILFVDNYKIFKIFQKNYDSMKKKIINHLKNSKFNIYGAGGSMVLAIASISKYKENINLIYDSDPAKLNYNFPGTQKKILANKKIYINKNFLSISNYDLKKKNNLNIQEI